MPVRLAVGEWSGVVPGAVLFGIFVAIGMAWIYVKRRSAMRTLENWRGSGIRQGLSPGDASIVIGAHPGVIVAALLEPILAGGRARVTSGKPIDLVWTPPAPETGLEKALHSAFGRGREGILDLLDFAWERMNRKMDGHSGRATAVGYRHHAKVVRDRALAAGRLDPDDRAWLVLADPDVLWDRSPADASGQVFLDLVRYVSLMRARLLSDAQIQAEAHRRERPFWLYRPDLRRHRSGFNVFTEDVAEGGRIPAGPFGDLVYGLARAIGGDVRGELPLPMPGAYLYRPEVIVEGHIDDRPVQVTFSIGTTRVGTGGEGGVLVGFGLGLRQGEADIGVNCSAIGDRATDSFTIVPSTLENRLAPFAAARVYSGDAAFDDGHVSRQADCPGLECQQPQTPGCLTSR